jgi:hypothetical protein
MATFKEIKASDITRKTSFLNQLVDVIQDDVSGSATRKKYEVFVTGGVGPGVTSSMFQTVFDQDFSLQTANAIFDMTVGIRSGSALVATASTGEDAAGKLLFPSQSIMMREKIDNYSQMAQILLGGRTDSFYAPWKSTDATNEIDNALFINFRRLFSRDQIKRETFAMRFYETGTLDGSANDATVNVDIANGYTGSNLNITSVSGAAVYTDVGSAANRLQSFAGDVGNIVDSANTSRNVGLMFYDLGIAVLDMGKVVMTDQHMSGIIGAMSNVTDADAVAGQTVMGSATGNPNATFFPDFMVSASIDNIVDHVASTRFSSGSITAMTFQNVTQINSSLIFCKANPNEFNYSSNPTYTDSDGQVVVVNPGSEEKPFSFVTTVGLYDASNRLLAVAKLSRPVEKNDTRDLTVRVRLDF